MGHIHQPCAFPAVAEEQAIHALEFMYLSISHMPHPLAMGLAQQQVIHAAL
jgi:hypothetical protein